MTTPIPMFRPALAARRYHNLSPTEVLDLSETCQFAGIEWSDFHVPSCNSARAAQLARATLDRGMSVAAYASTWPSGQTTFAQVVDTALVLGAPTIRIGATGIGSFPSLNQTIPDPRATLDLAHEAGISISFSYLPAAYHATVALIRQWTHPAARLYLRAPRALARLCYPETKVPVPFYVPEIDVLGSTVGRNISQSSTPNIGFSNGLTAIFDEVPPETSFLRLSEKRLGRKDP